MGPSRSLIPDHCDRHHPDCLYREKAQKVARSDDGPAPIVIELSPSSADAAAQRWRHVSASTLRTITIHVATTVLADARPATRHVSSATNDTTAAYDATTTNDATATYDAIVADASNCRRYAIARYSMS